MKEITRIHIAKIAYDIEIDAKKDLENYIKALERYANDQEILDDIEIRITELLTEQDVMTGGVITMADVAAVRARLGEPSDFASEDMGEDQIDTQRRRIYRDENEAVIGGVLAGLARSFGTDPLWLRLLFIVILFASFGTALIVYLILWLIIPPAQTAAEKLRMSGRSVTLASIKELAGNEEQRSKRAQMMRRIVSIFTGSFLVIAGIAGLIMIIGVLYQLKFGRLSMVFTSITDKWIYESWWFMAMLIFCVISGILFSILCFILASAAFRRRWTKRIGIAVVVIIVAGLLTFGSGIGAWMYGTSTMQTRIDKLHQNTSGPVPAEFKNITSFTFVDTGFDGTVPVQYIVSDTPHYELDSFPGIEPRFEMANDGRSAKVKLIKTSSASWSPPGSLGFGMTVLRLYGPALDNVIAESAGSPLSYDNEEGQAKFTIAMHGATNFSLGGKYDSVYVKGDKFGLVNLKDVAITELYSEGGGEVTAGVVRLLDVKQPDVCSVNDTYEDSYLVRVRGISGGKLIYNGVEQPAETISNSCGKVIIGDEGDTEDL